MQRGGWSQCFLLYYLLVYFKTSKVLDHVKFSRIITPPKRKIFKDESQMWKCAFGF